MNSSREMNSGNALWDDVVNALNHQQASSKLSFRLPGGALAPMAADLSDRKAAPPPRRHGASSPAKAAGAAWAEISGEFNRRQANANRISKFPLEYLTVALVAGRPPVEQQRR